MRYDRTEIMFFYFSPLDLGCVELILRRFAALRWLFLPENCHSLSAWAFMCVGSCSRKLSMIVIRHVLHGFEDSHNTVDIKRWYSGFPSTLSSENFALL